MKNQLKVMLSIFWISLILPLYIGDETVFISCIFSSVISSFYLIAHFLVSIFLQMEDLKKED